MHINASLDNGTAKLSAVQLNITTDIIIIDADGLAVALAEFITEPDAASHNADTYSIDAHGSGVKITTPTGAFDLPWRHIHSVVVQLSDG
jgi:hypothetical protein